MMPRTYYGLVICGMGSAGRSRLREVALLPQFELKGVVSRRPSMGSMTWQQALGAKDVQAIAISTENTDHRLRVEEALRAGKHVLCDYPLCFTAREADALYSLARRRHLILHVEHLGLLTKQHLAVRGELPSLTGIREIHYEFLGGWNQRLADPNYAGPPAFIAFSRLLQLIDWFGPLVLVELELEVGRDDYRFLARLQTSFGAPVFFQEKRGPDQQRHRSLTIVTDQGSRNWDLSPQRESLFLQDLQFFSERLSGVRQSAYYDENLMTQLISQLELIVPKGPHARAPRS